MLGKKKQSRRPAGQFDTLISAKTSIAGDLQFSGGLHVDGKIHGKVVAEEGSSAVLRISEVGEIEGNPAIGVTDDAFPAPKTTI